MQRFVLFVLASIVCLLANAQAVPVAVLTSGEDVKTFYGTKSLSNACNEANVGDIITLSPGIFESPDKLKKTVTIKGAGMDNTSNLCSRIVSSGIEVRYAEQPDDTTLTTTFENLYFDSGITIWDPKSISLKKCSLGSILQYESSKDITINSCHIRGELAPKGNLMATNSIFDYKMNISETGYHYFANCILKYNIPNSIVESCIFIQQPGDMGTLNTSTSATGCRYIGSQNLFFRNHTSDNEVISASESVFKPDTFYELSEQYATEWVGEDNTQIGIYGGPEPFSTVPMNPIITKFNVAPRTTADGKLSVDIEVMNPAK